MSLVKVLSLLILAAAILSIVSLLLIAFSGALISLVVCSFGGAPIILVKGLSLRGPARFVYIYLVSLDLRRRHTV